MRPLWECEAHRISATNELTVFMGVNVNPADQVRIRAAIEKETRARIVQDVETSVWSTALDGARPSWVSEADWLGAVNQGIAHAARIARGGAS